MSLKQKRDNSGKPRLSLVPPDWIQAVGRVLDKGLKKYRRDNWRDGAPPTEYMDSLMRHYCAFMRGEDLDGESGEPHLAHIAVNALMCLSSMEGTDHPDDRYPLRPRTKDD